VRVIQSPKLDGSALQFKYVDGHLRKATTRGDGEVGKDVNHHASTLAQVGKIPGTVSSAKSPLRKGTWYIRGELMIREDVFRKKWKGKKSESGEALKESRNAVNGFLTSQKLNLEFARDLVFVAYEIRDPRGHDIADKEETLKILAAAGFETYTACPQFASFGLRVDAIKVTKLFNEASKALKKIAKGASKDWPYNCDGLVLELNEAKHRGKVTTAHPHFARGFKVSKNDLENQDVHVTTCTRVEWRTSKSGALVPRVHYKPVKFGQTKNDKATGNNAAHIKKMGIGKGLLR
jgi:DNA ligase (NAD+)